MRIIGGRCHISDWKEPLLGFGAGVGLIVLLVALYFL
ncbi:hypothetical protein BH23ACI1_BH23ACI1_19900 [soil metagenome]